MVRERGTCPLLPPALSAVLAEAFLLLLDLMDE